MSTLSGRADTNRSANEEIARLRREVDVLQDQVKRLVRTERRLSATQQFLDRELQKIEALTEFDLSAVRADSAEEILGAALKLVLSLFSMEHGLAFRPERKNFYKLDYSLGLSGSVHSGSSEAIASFRLNPSGIPQGPWIGKGAEMKLATPARLFSFIGSLDEKPPRLGAGSSHGECKVMILPIFRKNEGLHKLLIAGCMGREPTLLDTFPQPSDLPFLRLLCTHIGMALHNLEAFQEVTEAVRVRDDFLSIASHELKTPLTSILLALELLKRDLQQNAAASVKVNVLEKQCRRQEALIEQLLDVGKIRAGRLEPRMAEIDFAALVRDVSSKFAEDIRASHAQLSLDLPPSLFVMADASQLEQVVANLISNAIKYGGGRISLRLRRRDGRVRLRVRDHGLGISDLDRHRIFQRFERAVSSRHFGGLGLGLYISRKIVESHHGAIRVKSSPGHGSVFVVELPVRPSAIGLRNRQPQQLVHGDRNFA